ncbi:MAG: McrC family protein [Candidatus Heimdallarchaeota archaeon]|nr:McrC family protein [Candidatus Heimdallarchaeota archaeon]MDH5646385.1 McrC family protein [Candidatus Heimdallarchaeota archaeon]
MEDIIQYQEYIIQPNTQDLKHLIQLASKHSFDLIPVDSKTYKLKTRALVGFIHLSNTKLYFKPKIPFTSLFYMITRTNSIKRVNVLKHLPAWLSTKDGDPLALVKIFIHIIEDFIEHGIRKQYKFIEEDLSSPIGTILIQKNITKLPWELNTIWCEYDDFTLDVFPNQIIRYTVDIIRRSLRDSQNKNLMNKVEKRLTGVTLLKSINVEDIDKINLTKSLDEYRPVLSFCRFILSNLTIDEVTGKNMFSSFLINMNTLYESFVFSTIKSEFIEFQIVKEKLKITGSMNERGKFIVYEPDIVVRENGIKEITSNINSENNVSNSNLIFVGDAKYKYLDTSKDELSIQKDFFQVLSYALFMKANKGIIFYPQNKLEDHDPILFKFSQYGIDIIILSLPLGGFSWNELDYKIKESMKELKSILSTE